MRYLMIGLALAMLAAPAAAANYMNAEEFHRRASALQQKGSRALLAVGEIRALSKAARVAGEAIRARRLAAQQAGQTPLYCPPKGSKRMEPEEFLRRLSAIPQAERRQIDLAEAMNRMLAAKYPCNG